MYLKLDFKAWNNKMPMNQKFIAVAKLELPNSGYSAELKKIASHDDEIVLELIINKPSPGGVYAQMINKIEVRYEEENAEYKAVELKRSEYHQVGDVN